MTSNHNNDQIHEVAKVDDWPNSQNAYNSLDHLHALVSHLVDDSCNVHHLLLLDLFQDIVNADEGPSATNTSTNRDKKPCRVVCKKHDNSHLQNITSYLQCTSIGPLLVLWCEMILLRKDSIGAAYSGTPWSGQDV